MTSLHAFFRPAAAAVAVVLALGGCAHLGGGAAADAKPADSEPIVKTTDVPTAELEAIASPELPRQELTSDLLYDFLLAEIAAQRGNANVSAQTYVDLADRTKDPRIARRAHDIALAARAPVLAIRAAEIWLEADPKSLDARRRLAALLLATHQLEAARPHLEHLLAAGAVDRAEVFTQLTRLIAGNPNREANLRIVQDLAAANADLPEAHFAVAHAAGQAQNYELALKSIREALRLKPDWETGVLLEAQILQKSSGNDAARARLAEYLQQHPDALDIRLNHARLLVADRQYEAARDEFEGMLRDNPLNGEALYASALLALQLKDYPAAESRLKRLLELNYRDRDTVTLYLGQIAEEQKRYAEALDWYEDIIAGEHYLTAKTRQAGVLAKQGDIAGARKFLQQIKVPSNQQRVQLILAEAHLLRDAGQYQEAFGVLSRGLEKLPNDPDLLYDQAMIAEKLNRLDVLESSLRKLIRLRPDHPHAYNALGYSFADRNMRLAEARKLIEKAHELAPDDAFILDSMGWVLFRQGDHEQAEQYLRRAHMLRPDPEIAAHLGEVLWVAGRHDEARQIWQAAKERAPDNEALLQTLKRLRP